jgi:hypothetical protein
VRCAGPVALVEAQQSQFFVISRRRILPDGGFHLARPAAALHEAESAGIEQFGEGFNRQVDQRSQRPQENDEVEPIEAGLAADKVNQRHRHQRKAEYAPGKKVGNHQENPSTRRTPAAGVGGQKM